MDESELRLDGNACAGLLREIFVHDMTAARGACSSCGAVGYIGAQHLYDYPHGPGAVLRCSSCESLLMVVVRTGTRYRLGTQGFFWSRTFASSVLAATIHIEAAGPQMISVARLAVDAMLAVPPPDRVGSQSVSESRQIRVQRA